MSFDTPDDPHSRDTALARMLAEVLKSQSTTAAHAKNSECPDAEVIATYAEHGLAEEETARWEIHFADCDRCQKIIAVLAASGEELTKAEVERLGNLAAASSAAREPVVRNTAIRWMTIWQRPALWRWLVPAVGMASAAALWLALRPAPPRETPDSQRIVATTAAPQNGIGQGATATPSAKPGETQMAQANVPPPPPPPGALLRDKETAQANSSAAARQEPLQKQETFRSAAQAPQVSEADGSLETRGDAPKDNRVPSTQATEKSKIADALSTVAPAAPAAEPSTPPPVANRERATPQGLDAATGAPAPARLKSLAQPASQAIVFASPNRRALWRLGSGGRIEHSTDQGQTWQAQSSGVTADLLAGAAPSEKVAWVVGRLGTVVRTEDGEHWQRLALPSGTQPVAPSTLATDWIGVEAPDALHATITSQDLRRFVTEDGGRTWAQLP